MGLPIPKKDNIDLASIMLDHKIIIAKDSRFYYLWNPQYTTPSLISEFTPITNAMEKYVLPFHYVMDDFIRFIGKFQQKLITGNRKLY